MNRITPSRPVFVVLAVAALAAGVAASAFAVQYPSNAKPPTPTPNGAAFNLRVYNDCMGSSVITTNQYPDLVSIEDTNLDCFGFANLHAWSFSTDGGATAVPFDNPAAFRFSAELVITGSGDGEAGLRISPWYSQYNDGRVNVRIPDGEIACFGGRLPFYSFTATNGIHYVKGEPIRIEMIYQPHGLAPGKPATIQYNVTYQGTDYTSGVLPFDQGNETEDMLDGRGQWGMLNDGRVGGFIQPRLGNGTAVDLKATFTNIGFVVTPPVDGAIVNERVFNDCMTSTLTTVNDYPSLISFQDANLDCFGFANLHSWSFAEDEAAAIFNNNSSFRASTDLVVEGNGGGEAGLRISPWYGQLVDGRFNVRSTDGEIACFGGRLPFFSFTSAFNNLRYTKGDPIHLEVVYDANGRTQADPATIEYHLSYLGNDYTSPELPFDLGNATEDSLFGYGLYGIMNDSRAGGYLQAFLGQGTSVTAKATYTNITFSTCLRPADVSFAIKPQKLNTRSNGPWVTAYITPEPPLQPSDIDVASLRLNGVPAEEDPSPSVHLGSLKVRFSRPSILATVSPGGTLVLTGEIAGQCIETSTTIEVSGPLMAAPVEAAILKAGSVADVVWEADPHATSTQLLVSADNGVHWTVAVQNLPNTGSYSWMVPHMPTSAARLAVASIYEQDEYGIVTESEYSVSAAFSIAGVLSADGNRPAFSMRAQNPVQGPLRLTFSLPTTEAADLAVFDIAGRAVVSRPVGGQAGSQSVMLGKLPAGLYVVRLTQSGRSLSNRVTVVQ